MTHPYNDHSTAGHYIQTGHPWHVPIGGGFNATEKDWPTYGSVVDYLDERAPAGATRDMPGFVYLPNRLGHIANVFDEARSARPICRLAGARLRSAGHADRQARRQRQSVLPRLHGRGARFSHPGAGAERGLDARSTARPAFAGRAVRPARRATRSTKPGRGGLRSVSPAGPVAGHVRKKSARRSIFARSRPRMRDRYGRHLFGQSTLLARRLVEAGTRFVTVAWDAPDGYGWDSHVIEQRRARTIWSRAWIRRFRRC